jgi:polyisoprenoid-binding protein YceI
MHRLAVVPCFLSLLCGGLSVGDAAERGYVVDAEASDIQWLVYRAGTLSRFGHNHVISVADLEGRVTVDSDKPSASRFEISFPVAALVVDDPLRRKDLGEEFASVPSENDIAGTRTNMLGDRVLNGENFPKIRITGTGPLGSRGEQTLAMKVEMLGRTIDLTVPTEVVVDDRHVEAHGQFELDHADLGLQPFTVMLGALQVGEKITFSYRVSAHATQ